jgi:N-methylhydantoinase A/oxoprolinase/acetone carboxylase beta subunit
MTTQSSLRVGVDIGGTFTDLVAFDDSKREMLIAKTPSVPGDYATGVINALNEVIDDYGAIELFINGTTAPLNAFLERKGARTALITTRGFGDVYVIRRSNRSRMYDLHYAHPEPLVPRRLTFEVEERLDARGEVVTPLNEADLAAIIPRSAKGRHRVGGHLLSAQLHQPRTRTDRGGVPAPRSAGPVRHSFASRSAASGASTSAPAPPSSMPMSHPS